MMTKPGGTGIRKLINSTRYSWWGVRSAWKNEEAFRLECCLAAVMIPLSFVIGENLTHSLLMMISVTLVILAEIINTALESVVDRISSEQHPLAGQAKDLGSAAVFLSLLVAATVWLLSLWQFFTS